MSEENVASHAITNEKVYLGVIVVLVLTLIYLLLFGPKQERLVLVGPDSVSESVAIKEGWTSFKDGGTFEDFVATNNIQFIVAIDDKLQSYIGDEKFAEVPLCARPAGGTGVAGECAKLAGSKTPRTTTLSFKVVEGSSNYCGGRGGYMWCK